MKHLEAKLKSIGRIHVMPRKVFWVGMPESFKEKDKIELFQKDIWIIRHLLENLMELEAESEFTLFINLDSALFAGRSSLSIPEGPLAVKLIHNISKIKPLHTIVHTTHISPKIKELFTKASFTYVERNLHDTTAAIATILKTVNFIYEKTNRTTRAFLRIEISENDKIPVKCLATAGGRNTVVDGHIGDLSLNGMQVKFTGDNKTSLFSLKDFAELTFFIDHHQIKIQKALVARIDPAGNSIGLYFDIHNEKMVKTIYARHFTDILYQMLKEFLATVEK